MWLFYAGCGGWLCKILWDDYQRTERARYESLNSQLRAIQAEVWKLAHPEEARSDLLAGARTIP